MSTVEKTLKQRLFPEEPVEKDIPALLAAFNEIRGNTAVTLLREAVDLSLQDLTQQLTVIAETRPDVDLTPVKEQLDGVQITLADVWQTMQSYLEVAKRNADLEYQVLTKLKAKLG